MAKSRPDEAIPEIVQVTSLEPVQEPVMGIDRYLESNPASSQSISMMLADLFKGQIATTSQWAERITAVLMRNA